MWSCDTALMNVVYIPTAAMLMSHLGSLNVNSPHGKYLQMKTTV